MRGITRHLAIAPALLAVVLVAAACSDDAGSGSGGDGATAAPAAPFGTACSDVPAEGAGSFEGMMTQPVRHLAIAPALLAVVLVAAACSDDAGGGSGGDGATAAPAAPFGTACSDVPAEGAGSFEGMMTQPVVTAAAENPLLTALVADVELAGLTDTLNTAENLTVFAPTRTSRCSRRPTRPSRPPARPIPRGWPR